MGREGKFPALEAEQESKPLPRRGPGTTQADLRKTRDGGTHPGRGAAILMCNTGRLHTPQLPVFRGLLPRGVGVLVPAPRRPFLPGTCTRPAPGARQAQGLTKRATLVLDADGEGPAVPLSSNPGCPHPSLGGGEGCFPGPGARAAPAGC